ncbi:MAG TPA: NAD(P)/FAD-dependent oxidoreductase [Myxococcales bacterium]|nr:NAD(P)/FAD-dependent oxidoreductase [Myxococcales bacterium]
MIYDVLIAGGGPAGLAAAIRSAQRGFGTVLLERGAEPPDKACGEGLMPSGVRELSLLGARIPPEACSQFHGIRYLQEDGSTVEARFRAGFGLGIRRTLLSQHLRELARACGAELRHDSVLSATAYQQHVEVKAASGTLRARLLVAADGLHSPLRRAAGLEESADARPQRYGLRRHFALAPWTDMVEVFWTPGVEAYVTPVGPQSVNVAFLREGDMAEGFDGLLARFPALQARLRGAAPLSQVRGAGPLLQRVRARHTDRMALLGDAAGYVDAITGQGLSLAFAGSALLMDALPQDLSQDLGPALRRYDASVRRRWLHYAVPAHALVALSRRPALRREAIRSVAALPGAFGAVVRLVG